MTPARKPWHEQRLAQPLTRRAEPLADSGDLFFTWWVLGFEAARYALVGRSRR
jgi:hypothetical protein